MSDKTIPERYKQDYEGCDQSCFICHMIEELGAAETTIGKLEQALRFYRLEHARNNCYFSGPTGAICDECEAVDKLMAALHAPDKAVNNG